jgi:hypothetical protein
VAVGEGDVGYSLKKKWGDLELYWPRYESFSTDGCKKKKKIEKNQGEKNVILRIKVWWRGRDLRISSILINREDRY